MRGSSSFVSLRISLLAALGLGPACGGRVVVDGAPGEGGEGPAASSASSASGLGGGPVASAASAGVSTGAVGTSVGTSVGTGAGGAPPACAAPAPIVGPDGSDTGFVRCADGSINRAFPVECAPVVTAPACKGSEGSLACKTDADCQAGPHGRCIHFDPAFDNPIDSCGCVYPCASDEECGPGRICVCPGVVETGRSWPTCASHAECRTGAECPSGECGITSYSDGCGFEVGLACRSPGDLCRVDAECPHDGSQCVVTQNDPESYACWTESCVIGRPLLVAGAPRRAPLAEGPGWAGARPALAAALAADLAVDLRAALARRWAEVASLEHASVGSFARFTLELLSLGAPAELLAEAQRAGADEIEHARICFSIARAYAGRELAPGPLSLEGLLARRGRRAIALALVEEACVGETVGALEALDGAAGVREGELKSALLRIAEDEARHAELAWKALAWLLEDAEPSLLAEIAEAFSRASAALLASPPAGLPAPAHGLPGPAAIATLRHRAVTEVIEPCAAALLAPSSRRSSPA